MINIKLNQQEADKKVTVNEFLESKKKVPTLVTNLSLGGIKEEKIKASEVMKRLSELKKDGWGDSTIEFIPGIFPKGITVSIGLH